ncbi:40S ribosomal protein S6-2, partial [Bienertia sinuspersici]
RATRYLPKNVHKYVNTYQRMFTAKTGTKVSKTPKIQCVTTLFSLQSKRTRIVLKQKRISMGKFEATKYQKLLVSRLKE